MFLMTAEVRLRLRRVVREREESPGVEQIQQHHSLPTQREEEKRKQCREVLHYNNLREQFHGSNRFDELDEDEDEKEFQYQIGSGDNS